MFTFKKVSSPEACARVVDFLTKDVMKHGGSASETINMHNHLWDITVCQVPWGTLVLKQEITQLEALAKLFIIE